MRHHTLGRCENHRRSETKRIRSSLSILNTKIAKQDHPKLLLYKKIENNHVAVGIFKSMS